MPNKLKPPSRGFSALEYAQRTQKLQQSMLNKNIDAVFFTTEPEFRYYSGFKSQFWHSPTRPWFLVIPARGKPIAVVPNIGVAGFKDTWVDDVRSWPSPRPEDDGIRLLTDTLLEVSRSHSSIGAMLGPETHLRMPVNNYHILVSELLERNVLDISQEIRELLNIKSAAEIEKTRFACEVTAHGFEFLRDHLHAGMTEREACKAMHLEMLRVGADNCPYLISASGNGGYDNIIMGPTDRALNQGDILIIDTGANFDGYFSDFDRNFAIGKADSQVQRAYENVYCATQAGLDLAAPGRTTGELWQAMWSVLEKAGALGNNVGRMGHGLGMQLTQWPSIIEGGDTLLKPGMVLTLEPGMSFAPGKMMVHEDNILITANGCEVLHQRTWPQLPVIMNR